MVKRKQYKRVQCPTCGEWFNSAQGLGGHQRLKHGERKMTKAGVLSKPAPALVERLCPTCGGSKELYRVEYMAGVFNDGYVCAHCLIEQYGAHWFERWYKKLV